MASALASLRGRLDRAGMVLSGLCAVHCVLSLVLVSLLGIGGGVLANPAIHRVGIALAVVIGLVTIGLGTRRHGQRAPLAIGLAGLALMATALFVHHGVGEAALTISGVALVALAHVRNIRASLHGAC